MLTVGVIGCGHWGPNHIRNFSRVTGAQVVACADTSEARLTAVRRQFPDLRGTTDAQDILRDPAIDAVVIATPTATHARLTTKALRAGKHVLVEKPLAHKAAEARRLETLAADCGRVLMVGHVFLYNGGIQALRTHMRRACGPMRYLYAARTNLGPFRQDVNVVADLASHDVSIFSYLLDEEPVEVSARAACFLQDDIADVAFITLQFPSGVMGHIHVSWLDPQKVRTITAVGARRMVTWDDMHPTEPVRIFNKSVKREPYYADFGEFRLLATEGAVVSPKVRLREPLLEEAEAFVRACRTGRAPLADATHGRRTVEVLDAIQRSIKAGGAARSIQRAD